MLQLEDGFGIEQVEFTFPTPLIFTTDFESAVGSFFRAPRVGNGVTHRNGRCNDIESDTAKSAHRSGEIRLDQLFTESYGFKNLGPCVAGNCRNPHLRHHLQYALTASLDVVADRFLGIHSAEAVQSPTLVGPNQILNRFKGQVGVNRTGPVSDQQSHMVNLTRITALHDETNHRPLACTHEVVMHRRCQK